MLATHDVLQTLHGCPPKALNHCLHRVLQILLWAGTSKATAVPCAQCPAWH